MTSLLLLLVLSLLGSAPLYAQLELSVETRVRVEAPEGFDAYTWQVPATLKFEQRGNKILLEGPAGKYRVNVSALRIDWDSRQFEQQTGFIDVTIGEGVAPDPVDPDLPPEPDPTIPEDEFGNIGRRAAAWAKELKLKDTGPVAENYEEAAKRLLGEKEPILRTIDLAEEWLGEQNGDLPAEWREWGAKINESYQDAQTDRFAVGRFFRAIAKGLEAVK